MKMNLFPCCRPTPASGSHPSSAHPTPAAHQHQGAQSHPPAHPSQHAAAGMSNQSAQTAMAAPKPAKGKAGKAPGTAASSQAQSKEVLEQVYAAAKKGQKEAMLVALLQCRPPKHHVRMLNMSSLPSLLYGVQVALERNATPCNMWRCVCEAMFH